MIKGQCLCGRVKIVIEGALSHPPEACHCSQCRKQSGHFLAAVNVKRDSLLVSGEDSICWYQSSEKVERGFCKNCGSSLFWKPNIEGYEYTAVCLGLIDDRIEHSLAKHTFVSDKGRYYDINDGVPQSDQY